jgi:hypothetical protein
MQQQASKLLIRGSPSSKSSSYWRCYVIHHLGKYCTAWQSLEQIPRREACEEDHVCAVREAQHCRYASF